MIEIALTGQVMLWVIIIGLFMASGQASIFHPATAYLGFHGLVFIARPILVHSFGFDTNWKYMWFKPTEAYFMKTLAVSSVAMVAFVVASVSIGCSRLSFGKAVPPEFTSVERRALLITTLLLIPVAAYSIFATRNGIEGERVNGIYTLTNSTGYVNEAQHFIMPLLCAWLLVTRFHWLNLLPSFFYIGYRVWFGWSRWTILLFLLMVTMAYCWYYRKKWLPLWSVAAALPILLVFNLLGHNRDILKSIFLGEKVQVVDFSPGMTAEEKLKKQLDTQDYANFDYLSYVVSVVPERTETYTYGVQYLQLFTEPIPRILWRGKPVGAPVKSNVNLSAYGNFVGLTVSLAGDGWLSGGWIGLIITLSTVGGLLGWAHRLFWQNIEHRLGCSIYLVGLAMVPQWYRDGGISISKFLLFTLTPLVIWVGLTWVIGDRLVLGHSVLLPRGTRLRFVETEANRQ